MCNPHPPPHTHTHGLVYMTRTMASSHNNRQDKHHQHATDSEKTPMCGSRQQRLTRAPPELLEALAHGPHDRWGTDACVHCGDVDDAHELDGGSWYHPGMAHRVAYMVRGAAGRNVGDMDETVAGYKRPLYSPR